MRMRSRATHADDWRDQVCGEGRAKRSWRHAVGQWDETLLSRGVLAWAVDTGDRPPRSGLDLAGSPAPAEKQRDEKDALENGPEPRAGWLDQARMGTVCRLSPGRPWRG